MPDISHCQHIAGDATEWVGRDLSDVGVIYNFPVNENTKIQRKLSCVVYKYLSLETYLSLVLMNVFSIIMADWEIILDRAAIWESDDRVMKMCLDVTNLISTCRGLHV